MLSLAASVLKGTTFELARTGNQQTLYSPTDTQETPELLAGSYDTPDSDESSVWLIKIKNPEETVERLLAVRATSSSIYWVTFKHYHSQFATVNKINLDYFINRPDQSKEFFIFAANTLRGVGVMDELGQVPLEPTHSMGLIF